MAIFVLTVMLLQEDGQECQHLLETKLILVRLMPVYFLSIF